MSVTRYGYHQATLNSSLVISGLHKRTHFLRAIARILLLVCPLVWYAPVAYSINTGKPQHEIADLKTAVRLLGADLKLLRDRVLQIRQLLNQKMIDWQQVSELKQAVISQVAIIKEHDIIVRKTLAADLNRIAASQLPAINAKRREASIRQYTAKIESIYTELGILENLSNHKEPLEKSLSSLTAQLKDRFERTNQSYGNDLDIVSPPPRDILLTQGEIEALIGQSGDPNLPDSAYLTVDAATQTSPALEDLVASLGGSPIELYNWVYNNIRWLPSYGVMQGADYTYQARQGNAFDTASLLISLYRIAGIPARYNYGSVAIPIAQAQNWVGDVEHSESVAALMSQGKIPQRRFARTGAVEEIEFEHVWVQVKIDNEWIDVDPSFKQYDYKDGIDLRQAVPFDEAAFLNQIEQLGVHNQEEGWLQGIDDSAVKDALSQYEEQVESFLVNNHSGSLVGDIIGTQTIIESTAASLNEVSLPYVRTLASQVTPNLPEALFYRFKLQIGSVVGGGLIPETWGSVLAELDDVTPNLVGKQINVSFQPATDEDEQILLNLVPEDIQSVEDFPESYPAGTINMVGQITVDGEVVANTSAITLGQILMTRTGFTMPGQNWRFKQNNVVGGEYHAVGIDMQGISPEQLDLLASRLEATRQRILNSGIENVTKHDAVGGQLQSVIQLYLANTHLFDKFFAQASDTVYYRMPSFGSVALTSEVDFLFGTPSNMSFKGLVIDIDQLGLNSESKNNCHKNWLTFNRNSGARSSSFEHQIFEQLLSTEQNPLQATSTMSAIANAMVEGQRTYKLTQSNQDQLASITIDDSSRQEIIQALNLGFEVVAHEEPISLNGWAGSGYSIVDLENGTGVYKISGGFNGAAVALTTSNFSLPCVSFSGLVGKLADIPQAMVLSLTSCLNALLDDFIVILSEEIANSNCLFETQKNDLIDGLYAIRTAAAIGSLPGSPALTAGASLGVWMIYMYAARHVQINEGLGSCPGL